MIGTLISEVAGETWGAAATNLAKQFGGSATSAAKAASGISPQAFVQQNMPATAFAHRGYGGLMGVVGGAMTGGIASYATGGEFHRGAFAGAIGGGAMGFGMGRQVVSRAGRALGRGANTMGKASFSTGMTKVGNLMESKESRRLMFGSGALLGGIMFGGRRNHSRGFNQNRGNRFGR